MARRGRFGRRPRSSPDLTATIVAMAREYQNMRDRNIVNSWEKGGKFEGKQVTDEALLSHLKSRAAGLAKDDPMYDEASQRVDEYTFSISNSKMELRYAQGKASDASMASFYNKWSGKLPQNSEAWRNMQTLAAQYRDRAKSAGGGGGGGGRGGGRSGGYNSDVNNIPAKKEVAYDTMVDALTEVARREGILNTKRETLADLRVAEGDASRMVQLLNIFNTEPAYKPYRDSLTAHIKRWGNPNFSGNFTWDTLQAEKINKVAGLNGRILKAQKAGHATDTKKLTTQLVDGVEVFNTLTAATPLARYEDARDILDTRVENESATPLDRYLALQDYTTSLIKIHQDVSAIPADMDPKVSVTAGHLNNEILSLTGGGADLNAPTLWEDSRGTVAGYKQGGGGETSKHAEDYRILREQVLRLVDGTGVVMRVDENGQPTDRTDAPYGVVEAAKVGSGVAWVPTGGHLPKTISFEGKTIDISGVMTAVLPVPVYTDAIGPADFTGRPTAAAGTPKSNANIANMFTMPDGTKLAQYWDANGGVRWTNDPDSLFVDSVTGARLTPEDTRDGLRITVTSGPKAKTYDPQSAIDPQFRDPTQADQMVNKVGRSSFTVWLNSTRSDKNDPGVAYAMDPAVMARAITKELGTAKPGELAAALYEAEAARTDYLAHTPDIDRRIRAAAEKGRTGTVADKLGVEGYADIAGLSRDVQDFYQRLRQKADNPILEDRLTRSGLDEANERDVIIKKALMQDPEERARIAMIEAGPTGGLPSHIRDLMHQQQTKAVLGPGINGQPLTGQAAVVQNFKALTASQLGGAAGALGAATAPVITPLGGLRPVMGGPAGALMRPGIPAPTGPTAPRITAPPPPKMVGTAASPGKAKDDLIRPVAPPSAPKLPPGATQLDRYGQPIAFVNGRKVYV